MLLESVVSRPGESLQSPHQESAVGGAHVGKDAGQGAPAAPFEIGQQLLALAAQGHDYLSVALVAGLAIQVGGGYQAVAQAAGPGGNGTQLISQLTEIEAPTSRHRHKSPKLGGRDLRVGGVLSPGPDQDQGLDGTLDVEDRHKDIPVGPGSGLRHTLPTVPPAALNSAATALLAMEAAPASAIVSVLERVLAEQFSVTGIELFMVDYRLSVLQAVTAMASRDAGRKAPLTVDGSGVGRTFASQEMSVEVDADARAVMRLPVTVRSDRLGVLEIHLPDLPSAELRDQLSQVATALGHALSVARRDTDLFEQASRAQRLGVAAEMQWQLLPGRGCVGPGFCLAGQLEPAYHVAGDNFDWCVSPDHLYLSVSDGMGRGVPASLLTTLAVNALRNARRSGLSLADQAQMADQAIHGIYGGDQFVAALLLRFDHRHHRLTAVDAGSPLLLRQRGGGIEAIQLEKQMPLGLFQGTHYIEQELDISPGDRFVIVSDGVHAARPPGRGEFGEARLKAVVRAVRLLSPGEAVRQLIRELHAHHDDGELRDDAVAVVCDWEPAK